MNEQRTSNEWVAYLRELADAQTKQQIAVNIRQAADYFEDALHGAEVGAAILRDRVAANVPGEQYRVFCPQHDEHRARYHDGRPMLNDQCPTCVIEKLRAALEPCEHQQYAAVWHRLVQAIATILEVDGNGSAEEVGNAIADKIRTSQPPFLSRPPQDAQTPLDAIRRLNAWLNSPHPYAGGVWLDHVPESFMDAWGNADYFLQEPTSETKEEVRK